jgi:MarR family transcriptional regulator, organic hydroperoxide resistance regulator
MLPESGRLARSGKRLADAEIHDCLAGLDGERPERERLDRRRLVGVVEPTDDPAHPRSSPLSIFVEPDISLYEMSVSRTSAATRSEAARAGKAVPRRVERAAPAPSSLADKAAIDRIVETAIYLQAESRRIAKDQCARHGITATQLNALKLMQKVGDLSLSELSRRMSATNSSITGIVDRMVAAGLVAREQSATDRRVWKIRLTPEGRALARKIDVAPWEILQTALVALPPAELEQLIKTLSKVVDHIEQVVATRGHEENR